MNGVLNALGYAVLPPDGKSIRWRNAAQWGLNVMVNEDGRMTKTEYRNAIAQNAVDPRS